MICYMKQAEVYFCNIVDLIPKALLEENCTELDDDIT